jgi:PAS domain-containing protein
MSLMHTASSYHRTSYGQHLQDRLASALHRLSSLDEPGSQPLRSRERMSAEVLRKIAEDLERAIVEVREISASYERLRSSAEHALDRADLLLRLSPVPCVILDRSGMVVDANPAAARVVNLSQLHLVGRPFQLFVGSDRLAFVTRLSSLERSEGVTTWPVTIRPRERGCLKMNFAAAVDAEERVVAMLLPGDQAEIGLSGAVGAPAIELV